MKHQIHLVMAVLLCPLSVRAAEITTAPLGEVGLSGVMVTGEIAISDGARFAEVINRGRPAVVVLDSPGGSVLAALQIGQLIRLHRLATLVPPGTYCASACALTWLAGTPRFFQPGSRIGFHAAYEEQAGQKVTTGVGNALIGAYLSKLGLSFTAISYVEQAGPDDITWLTVEDAKRLGIKIMLVAPTEAQPPPDRRTTGGTPPSQLAPATPPDLPTPPAEPLPAQSIDAQAGDFVTAYFDHWSESPSIALRFFDAAYAAQVLFYGKSVDHETVLAGKRNFTQRWPVRLYSAHPDTVRSFCNTATRTCTVSGVVEWDCRNPQRNTATTGAAQFSLTMTMSHDRFEIIAENGAVISRGTR